MQVSPTAGTINNMCPVTPYYATADTTDAITLRTSLHNIIKGHISYPYSNGTPNTWEILSFADEDHNASVDLNPNVPEAVWMVYKNNSYPYNGGGMQSYNREHTWPKSYGFSVPTDNAPRTDAHHLMMSDVGYNSTRNNKYYDNCNPATNATCTNASLQTTQYDGDGDGMTEGGNTGSNYPGNSNWTNGSVFEAWDFRKGDVARAMFYMDVRYEGLGEVDSTGTAEPDLILTNDASLIQTSTGGTAYMGILSTLIQWHNQDPVDDIELQRNEVVFSYQGNRNPFVDHPEWVDCIFAGGVCSTSVPEEVFSNGFE
jgi:endonuclease I